MPAVDGDATEALDLLDRTRMTVAEGPLVGPVLARLVGIHAARAELPLDRLNDAVLVAEPSKDGVRLLRYRLPQAPAPAAP